MSFRAPPFVLYVMAALKSSIEVGWIQFSEDYGQTQGSLLRVHTFQATKVPSFQPALPSTGAVPARPLRSRNRNDQRKCKRWGSAAPCVFRDSPTHPGKVHDDHSGRTGGLPHPRQRRGQSGPGGARESRTGICHCGAVSESCHPNPETPSRCKLKLTYPQTRE